MERIGEHLKPAIELEQPATERLPLRKVPVVEWNEGEAISTKTYTIFRSLCLPVKL